MRKRRGKERGHRERLSPSGERATRRGALRRCQMRTEFYSVETLGRKRGGLARPPSRRAAVRRRPNGCRQIEGDGAIDCVQAYWRQNAIRMRTIRPSARRGRPHHNHSARTPPLPTSHPNGAIRTDIWLPRALTWLPPDGAALLLAPSPIPQMDPRSPAHFSACAQWRPAVWRASRLRCSLLADATGLVEHEGTGGRRRSVRTTQYQQTAGLTFQGSGRGDSCHNLRLGAFDRAITRAPLPTAPASRLACQERQSISIEWHGENISPNGSWRNE